MLEQKHPPNADRKDPHFAKLFPLGLATILDTKLLRAGLSTNKSNQIEPPI
jgi:hypothetical protein